MQRTRCPLEVMSTQYAQYAALLVDNIHDHVQLLHGGDKWIKTAAMCLPKWHTVMQTKERTTGSADVQTMEVAAHL